MWRAETRGDRAWMDRHLAPGFSEFGVSGQAYSREEILALDVGEIDAVLRRLHVRRLAEGVVLVTYQSEVAGEPAHRSSIWRLTAAGWQMEFHQGTPARTAPDGPSPTRSQG